MGQQTSTASQVSSVEQPPLQIREELITHALLSFSPLDLKVIADKLGQAQVDSNHQLSAEELGKLFQIDWSVCQGLVIGDLFGELFDSFRYLGELLAPEPLTVGQLLVTMAVYMKHIIKVDPNDLFFYGMALDIAVAPVATDTNQLEKPTSNDSKTATGELKPSTDDSDPLSDTTTAHPELEKMTSSSLENSEISVPTLPHEESSEDAITIDWKAFELPLGHPSQSLLRAKFIRLLTLLLIIDFARVNNATNLQLYRWFEKWKELQAEATHLANYFCPDPQDVSLEDYRRGINRLSGMITDYLLYLFKRVLNFREPGTLAKPKQESSTSTPNQQQQSRRVADRNKTTQFSELRLLTLPLLMYLSFTLNRLTAVSLSLDNMFKLYGADAGFSIRSLELRIFKWQAPTIVLIKGKRVKKQTPRYTKFTDEYPRFFPLDDPQAYLTDFQKSDDRLTYVAVVHEPWKHSNKHNFGDKLNLIVEMLPRFDVFAGLAPDLIYFNNVGMGLGFGAHQPVNKQGVRRLNPGDVSLVVEANLEYAVFRHLVTPTTAGLFFSQLEIIDVNYEDRMVITDIEVWGVGSSATLDEQRKQWEWEEKMAEQRKNVNVRSMGEERAFLEMAGIIQPPSGGGSV